MFSFVCSGVICTDAWRILRQVVPWKKGDFGRCISNANVHVPSGVQKYCEGAAFQPIMRGEHTRIREADVSAAGTETQKVYKFIQFNTSTFVARITLNHPQYNVLTVPMM